MARMTPAASHGGQPIPADRPPPRRLVRWGVRLAIAILWLAVVGLGLEVLAWYRCEYQPRRNPWVRAQDRQTERVVGEGSAQGLWDIPWKRYRTNAVLRREFGGIPYEVRTNSRGWRSPEVAVPKPAGVFRIACIGGSTTVEGVTNETTYPARLQAKLAATYGAGRIEVVNCGVSGVSSFTELELLPSVLELQPDLVVHYNVINDLAWQYAPTMFQLAPAWRRGLCHSRFLRWRCESWCLPPLASLEDYYRNVQFTHYRQFVAACRQANCEVVFCTFATPNPDRLDPTTREYLDWNSRSVWGGGLASFATLRQWILLYNRRLQEFGRQEQVRVLPVAEGLDGGMETFTDLCHLKPSGIDAKAELIARQLAPSLESRLKPVPPGP